MPRWQRQVSPQLQGALPMGEEGLLGELWVLLHSPSPGLVAAGFCQLEGSAAFGIVPAAGLPG